MRTQVVRIFLWLCAIFFAILLMFRARMIWPEHPTLLTVILFLFAISSIVMLVDTIRRGRPLRKPRRLHPLRAVLTVIAVITTFLALVGLLYYISPSLFIRLMSLLPESIQEAMFIDFVLRGTGFWIFAIVSGILWYIISRIR
jgi:hypothetical protein